ncbi:MAG: hypothetical protein HKM06_08210 [Spirochaetales bacterium]|nr:hypothetical protein [Spirochaetales bacterium]
MFMFTSDIRLLVFIGLGFILLTACQDQKTIPPEAYSLNGVWAPVYLVPEGGIKEISSKILLNKKFSWGTGRVISSGGMYQSLTIDIATRQLLIPNGDGLYTIDGIRMLTPNSFILSIYHYDEAFPNNHNPVDMRFDLVNENRLTTPGEKYMLAHFPHGFIRLSGPGK